MFAVVVVCFVCFALVCFVGCVRVADVGCYLCFSYALLVLVLVIVFAC